MQQGTATEDVRSPAPYNREKLEAAKRRVAALKGFYIHLTAFVLVNLGLTAINIGTGSEWWVQWVWLGWGIGIVAHALAVFGRGSKVVAGWEERKVRLLLEER